MPGPEHISQDRREVKRQNNQRESTTSSQRKRYVDLPQRQETPSQTQETTKGTQKEDTTTETQETTSETQKATSETQRHRKQPHRVKHSLTGTAGLLGGDCMRALQPSLSQHPSGHRAQDAADVRH